MKIKNNSFSNKMKESDEISNDKFSKICSICNNEKINLNFKNLKYSKYTKKLKYNFKYVESSEIIKKCFCNNNDNELYVHKYCILLKILFNFEIKCEKCNTIYNIKINKKYNITKIIYFCIVFFLIYILHLILYLMCIFLLFFEKIFKKNVNIKYRHIYILCSAILFIINNFILYFSVINNIKIIRYLFKYRINIFDAEELNFNNIKNINKFGGLLYDYYKWFYDNSAKNILINIHKRFIINNGNYNNNIYLNRYIKQNNLTENELLKQKMENISNNNIIENINETNELNNYISLKNISKEEKENFNPFLNSKYNNNKEESKKKYNFLDELYSDKTENNEENNNKDDDSENNKNIISTTIINKINEDKLNNFKINNNLNINKKYSKEINYVIEENSNLENTELDLNQGNKTNDNAGKSALIPNKNLMDKIIEGNNNYYQYYLEKRKQLKSFKIKQQNVTLKGKKIGDVEENEEIDFAEFEKGKMDSKISKISKFYFLKNQLSSGDLFKTKKSYRDVNLNISNPTISIANDEISNNRCSLKNNMIDKNNNFNNSNISNIFLFNKK